MMQQQQYQQFPPTQAYMMPQFDPNQQFPGYYQAAPYGFNPYMGAPQFGGMPMMMAAPVQGYQSQGYPSGGGFYQGRGGNRGGHHSGGHFGGGGPRQGGSGNNVQKFKTALCRHFQSQGSCSLGDNCSFAHGEGELRNISDPVPQDAQQKQQSQQLPFGGGNQYQHNGSGFGQRKQNYQGGGGYTRGGNGPRQFSHQGSHQPQQNSSGSGNYKTAKCKNFYQDGNCRYGDRCSFAHGDHELRKSQGGETQQQQYQMPQAKPMPPPPTAPTMPYAPVQQSQPSYLGQFNPSSFPVLGQSSQPNTQ